MKIKATHYVLAAVMAIAPLSSAEAHGRWHHEGPVIGLFALGAAAIVGTAMILTAPIRAVADAPGPYYAPSPYGYGYAPPRYAPAYPPQAYYAPPQPYYPPGPGYYAPPPAYYYGRR